MALASVVSKGSQVATALVIFVAILEMHQILYLLLTYLFSRVAYFFEYVLITSNLK